MTVNFSPGRITFFVALMLLTRAWVGSMNRVARRMKRLYKRLRLLVFFMACSNEDKGFDTVKKTNQFLSFKVNVES